MDSKDAVICSDTKCNWVYYNTYEKCPRCGNKKRLFLRDIIKGIYPTSGIAGQTVKKKEVLYAYELTSENLTGLGGPMGTERTWTNWKESFKSDKDAQVFALADYNKRTKEKLKALIWVQGRDGNMRSQDLGFVMYHIKKVKIN
jgi:hypothetical protein